MFPFQSLKRKCFLFSPFQTPQQLFNNDLLVQRRGEEVKFVYDTMGIGLHSYLASFHSLRAEGFPILQKGKMGHNSFSMLPEASFDSKLAFVYYYILHCKAIKKQ